MNKYRLLTALALAGTFVPSHGQGMPSCREISFRSELKEGEFFEQAIGNGLTFRIIPSENGSERSGWKFEIEPSSVRKGEWKCFVYTLTPPYRSYHPTDVNTEYGVSAHEAVGMPPRKFCFLAFPSDAAKAKEALDGVLWPKNQQDQESGLATLGSLSRGRGEFSILESKVTPGHAEPSGEGPSLNADRIRWIGFEVKLTVPVYFDVASNLQTKDIPCPADWHQWPWPF